MTPIELLLGGLVVALAGTNVYWRRRLSRVREGLLVTMEWEADASDGGKPTEAIDPSTRLAIEDAADTAGVPVEDLAERIETYEERASERASRIERLQEAWVASWWEAAAREPVVTEGPRVVTLGVDAGGHDVVRRFAIHAMESENEIVIAFDRSSGDFAVGASENVATLTGADGIAEGIVAEAGGGGGGSDQLATGRAPPGKLEDAIDAVVSLTAGRLESSIHVAE